MSEDYQKLEIVKAWADHCGIEVDDERVNFGWTKDRELFFKGWQALASEIAKITEAFRLESDNLKLSKSSVAVGGAIVYENVADMLDGFMRKNHVSEIPQD